MAPGWGVFLPNGRGHPCVHSPRQIAKQAGGLFDRDLDSTPNDLCLSPPGQFGAPSTYASTPPISAADFSGRQIPVNAGLWPPPPAACGVDRDPSLPHSGRQEFAANFVPVFSAAPDKRGSRPPSTAGGDNRVRGLVVEAVLAREPGCDWTARSAFCGLPSSAVRSCMGPRPTRIPRSGRRSQSVSASSRAIAATSSRFSGIADMFGPTKQLLDTEIIGPLLRKRAARENCCPTDMSV